MNKQTQNMRGEVHPIAGILNNSFGVIVDWIRYRCPLVFFLLQSHHLDDDPSLIMPWNSHSCLVWEAWAGYLIIERFQGVLGEQAGVSILYLCHLKPHEK